jgi:hypothetical protein
MLSYYLPIVSSGHGCHGPCFRFSFPSRAIPKTWGPPEKDVLNVCVVPSFSSWPSTIAVKLEVNWLMALWLADYPEEHN